MNHPEIFDVIKLLIDLPVHQLTASDVDPAAVDSIGTIHVKQIWSVYYPSQRAWFDSRA
jgi:hypothetical protein